MIDTIYIEEEIRDHPRVRVVLERFPKADRISCQRHTEVFNFRSQNFRLQKRRPALILAKKHGRTVLPAPAEYQIGADQNYYFSHMLNCLYDCRYCFLQGMYRSAHYVYFVNFEDFEAGITEALNLTENAGKRLCFFSGYDCDSLAMEAVTGFAESFLPFFEKTPEAWLELRTKSLQTSVLTDREVISNVIVSYTLTPPAIAREVEHGAPPSDKRLNRVQSLIQQGWMTGLRFDPLIPWPGYKKIYRDFFEEVFSKIDGGLIHSATVGPMRFPAGMYDRIVDLYPDDPLFARFPLQKKDGRACFPGPLQVELTEFVCDCLREFMPAERVFLQTEEETSG